MNFMKNNKKQCRNYRMTYSRAKGFTLIELAVVLVIVGILLGSFIGTFSSRIDSSRVLNTEREMEDIKQVLLAYTFSQSPPHLPCPDIDVPPDGREDREGTGECIVVTPNETLGIIPWVTLGLGYEDAWGMRYSYWADANYSNNAGFNISTGTAGSAIINTRLNDTIEEMVDNAVALIISHGKNGYGGTSIANVVRVFPAAGTFVDELSNLDVDVDYIFMSRSATDQDAATVGGEFDDALGWINAYQIKAKMVETGVLP